MATLENAVAARLRADTTLMAILTGKIWEWSLLGTEGTTSPKTTPDLYDAGLLKPYCVVKAGGEVDDPRIVDEGEQVIAETVKVECWLYERVSSAAITAAKDRIFILLQGKAFPGTLGPKRVFTLTTMPDPQRTGVMLSHVDYQISLIRGN